MGMLVNAQGEGRDMVAEGSQAYTLGLLPSLRLTGGVGVSALVVALVAVFVSVLFGMVAWIFSMLSFWFDDIVRVAFVGLSWYVLELWLGDRLRRWYGMVCSDVLKCE